MPEKCIQVAMKSDLNTHFRGTACNVATTIEPVSRMAGLEGVHCSLRVCILFPRVLANTL